MIERIPARVVDVGLAVLVALLAGGAAFAGDRQPLVVATTVAGSLLLVLRRSHPLLVLALVTAGTLALGFADRALLVASLAVALYSCGAYVPRARSLPAALGALAVTAVAFVVNQTGGAGSSLPMLALLAAAWVFGDNARERSERNEQRARDAVAQERARIARELHDVVSHNVSVMVVQAAAGNEVFAERPERAREALVAIEETGRRSLAELRRLLDVVDGADGDGTAPQPGLARLDELVERVRAAGVAVSLAVEGTPRELPSGVDVSAYRIVQEALTNTLKHARATSADVLVRYRADALELVVSDDGVGGVAGPDGRGLVGMRERVALFGGELRAGAEPGGGFAVRARMPVDGVIRVLLADDQALVRSGLRLILESRDDLDVVGEAANGREAVELAAVTSPDVVVMDIRMPELDGIEATRTIVARGASPRVLVLTTFDLDEYVVRAIRAGASGFLLKDAPPAQLVEAVRVVAAGDALLAPTVTRRLLERFARGLEEETAPPALDVLTERELEILRLVAQGLSNAEIAARLVVGETTVKSHVSSILRKLRLRDRVQAVIAAYDAGLVRPASS